jgi:cbb3-type cytochrome oxidase maturation protein
VNVIFILIAVSLLVAIGFLITFIWSIRSGQFDDEYTPSVRILFDDETNVVEEKEEVSGQRSAVSSQNEYQEPGTKN